MNNNFFQIFQPFHFICFHIPSHFAGQSHSFIHSSRTPFAYLRSFRRSQVLQLWCIVNVSNLFPVSTHVFILQRSITGLHEQRRSIVNDGLSEAFSYRSRTRIPATSTSKQATTICFFIQEFSFSNEATTSTTE